MMDQNEIRAKRFAINERRRLLQLDLEDLQDEARALMRRCPHPDLYNYTAMGEDGVKCPDCGYAT